MSRNRNPLVLGCIAWIMIASVGSLQAQNVITNWTAIASSTIIKNAGQGPSPAAVYFAYAAIATYDAVNAIQHRGQPFYYEERAWPKASPDAAAVAATHKVLVHYFPSQQTTLDQNYQTTLGAIAASPDAIAAGVKVGEASADALIAARANDGIGANVTYTAGNGPGAWQPTPPAFAAPATPWLGQMKPFTFDNPAKFLPPGPTPLDSVQWQRDYTITRLFGAKTGSVRTPAQDEIGKFYVENTAQQYARLFNSMAAQNHMSLAQTSRFMAMLWTGMADAAIGCYNAKYHYGFWRPVTAIPAGGGNGNLTADATWLPQGTTPNHPEYPAAHGCLTGSVSQMFVEYFGTTKVHFVVDSPGFNAHNFEDTNDFLNEVRWARIYAGFHYFTSVMDGGELGQKVAKHVARKYFRTWDDDRDRHASH